MTTKRLWARDRSPLTQKAGRAPSPSAPLKSKEQVLPTFSRLLWPGGARLRRGPQAAVSMLRGGHDLQVCLKTHEHLYQRESLWFPLAKQVVGDDTQRGFKSSWGHKLSPSPKDHLGEALVSGQ